MGIALCAYGALELDRAAFALPERIILDLWNYAGPVFVSVGYAAIIILALASSQQPLVRGRPSVGSALTGA